MNTLGPHLWKFGLGLGVVLALGLTWAVASSWSKAVELTMQWEVRWNECAAECEDEGKALVSVTYMSWGCVCEEVER